MAFFDPRSCLRDFLTTGRNIGQRPPSFSLRNVQRDINSVSTRIENIKDRVEGAIGAAARGDFLPGQLLSITNEFRCPPTAYANLFAQQRPPKQKFMFFTSFELHADLKQHLVETHGVIMKCGGILNKLLVQKLIMNMKMLICITLDKRFLDEQH